MLLRSSLIFLKFYWYSSSFLPNAFTRILEVIPSSYKRFPLPSSFQLLTECITFYSLPNWDFRIVGFKENIFSITSIFLVMLLGYYLDIKDYAIIPLGSLVNRRNAFINITNLIRFYGWSLLPNLLTLKLLFVDILG